MKNKLSIGTAQFGLDYGINNKIGRVNQKSVNKILDFAYRNKIRSIDTAKSYGKSENKIGEYIKHQDGHWNITTKISDIEQPLEKQIIDSKFKLGIQPGVILAHSSKLFFDKNFQGQVEILKNKKLISKVGLSVYTNDEISFVLKNYYNVDVIQLPLNILDTRLLKNGVLEELQKMNIEVHVRSIFLQGLLFMSESQLKVKFEEAIKPINYLKEIIKDQNINLAEFSLLFVSNLDFVNKIVIGIDSYHQLVKNLNTLQKKVSSSIFNDALELNFDNENILNPALWI